MRGFSRTWPDSPTVCSGNNGDTTEAEGIAFGMDGLSIVASTGLSEAHRLACDPLAQAGSSSTCSTNTNSGLVNMGGDWRRVLRVIYFGLEGPTPPTAPAAVNANLRACGGTERTTLVNNVCAPTAWVRG